MSAPAADETELEPGEKSALYLKFFGVFLFTCSVVYYSLTKKNDTKDDSNRKRSSKVGGTRESSLSVGEAVESEEQPEYYYSLHIFGIAVLTITEGFTTAGEKRYITKVGNIRRICFRRNHINRNISFS